MPFFETLSKLMSKNTISVKQLSKTLEIDENEIQNWKDNHTVPDMQTLILLADYFHCSVDYLIGHKIKRKVKKVSKKPTRSINIEDYTADQCKEITLWSNILNEWEDYCIGKLSKTQATKDFATIATLKYPSLKISANVLYRKKRVLREYGVCGLIDLRGGHNKNCCSIPTVAWEIFLNFYNDLVHYDKMKCYNLTVDAIEKTRPELLPLPSYNTFVRKLKKESSSDNEAISDKQKCTK